MTLINIFNAFSSLQIAYKLALPYSKSRKIMKLLHKVKPDCQFYIDKERELAEQYAITENGKLKIEDGKISFASDGEMQAYLRKIEELRNMEIEWDFPIIHITDAEIGNQPISGEDIETLAPFITFGGD